MTEMNLAGVTELDARELRETEGGESVVERAVDSLLKLMGLKKDEERPPCVGA